MANIKNNESINKFVEFLQIASVQPNVNYDPCIEFLKKQCAEIELGYNIFYMVPNKPIFVITWEGLDTTAPSIMLNSHMDVVPVSEDKWIYPPFSGHIDEEGRVFARGSQDMKGVAIQYIEAVKRLMDKGIKLKRSVHICFAPDEEIGGVDGMSKFVKSDEFKALNVGMVLDEGMANPNDEYLLFYGERSIWHMIITCTGPPGHGMLLLKDTAGEKIRVVIDKFIEFREKERKKLDDDPSLTLGDVTTVNLTRIYGGVQTNVIPESLSAVFDVRIAVDVNHQEFETMIKEWCEEAGEGIIIEYEQKSPYVEPTKIDDTNPYWIAFKKAADELKITISPRIFPGGSDSRYIRGVGLPALGFSPMAKTPYLAHDNNEFQHSDVFLNGINTYEKLITAVANV